MALGRLALLEGGGILRADSWKGLKQRIAETVDAAIEAEPHRKHVKAEEIRRKAAPHLDEAAFEIVLVELCREEILEKVGSGYHRNGFSAALKPAERRLLQDISRIKADDHRQRFQKDVESIGAGSGGP